MITQGQNIPDGTVKTAQVCIIGSGPAGITLAWYLDQLNIKVIVLEGSRDFGVFNQNDPKYFIDKLNLYNGKVEGLLPTSEPGFLTNPTPGGANLGWERERYLGGTSLHWGGQSRPLDPITFEARKNFPGWPIKRPDLDPYYKEAFTFCNLYGSAIDPENWQQYFDAEFWASEKMLNAKVPDLEGMQVDMYQFIGLESQKKFSQKEVNGQTLATSDFEVIVNATLLGIDKVQNNVNSISVASMTMDRNVNPPQVATQFTVEAPVYVLACGGVANARQLLLNDIGNEFKQVGKNFITQSVNRGALQVNGQYLDPEEMRLMQGTTPNGQSWSNDPRNAKYRNGLQGRIVPKGNVATKLGIARCWFRVPGNTNLYFEQSPNMESQISLSDTLDPVFKQRQSTAIWNYNEQDEFNFNTLIDLFKVALKKRNFGLSWVTSWQDLKNTTVVNGHHLGTTKMSTEPKDGVVDRNLKVHGVDNLYVAGSSVFTTGGLANPTFTIITLSIRLAKHLGGVFGKESKY